MRIFELVEIASDATEKQRETVRLFHDALDLFEKREWPAAEEGFKKVLELTGDDNPSRLYLERCELYRMSPLPEDWDGVFDLTGK